MEVLSDQPMTAADPCEAVGPQGSASHVSGAQSAFDQASRRWPFARTAAKAYGCRVIAPDLTFKTLQPFFKRIGITRVADITGLDRLGIPVYTAIVPRSADSSSVYHGKGPTAIDAKTGAVMEATERYIASRQRLPDEVATYQELSASTLAVDPRGINQVLHPRYSDSTPIAWLSGIDLLSGDRVLAPHSVACLSTFSYPWQPSHAMSTSNGLASGNTLEEAACHALAEVIERDAHSMFETFHLYLQALANRMPSPDESRLDRLHAARCVLYPVIDPDSVSGKAAALVACFRSAGMEPELVYAGSESGAAVVLCFLREGGTGEYSRLEYGAGADPDVAVAAIRAMTEVAQGRAACMEAVREDLNAIARTTVRPGTVRAPGMSNARGGRGQPSFPATALSSIASYSTSDIVDDIRIMLAGLRRAGIERCVLVDLSTPELPIKVVRIIAPGLESWIVDHGKIGARARARWREFAARVQ